MIQMSGYRRQSFARGHIKLGLDGGVKPSAGQLEDLGPDVLRSDKGTNLGSCSSIMDAIMGYLQLSDLKRPVVIRWNILPSRL
jgi:hypothetical protein